MHTISEILKEEREKKGLSIDDVVNATKIKKSFISAIEKGNFQDLPSGTYATGFVKNYAQFLGIPEGRAAALLRREYEAKKIEVLPKFRKNPGPGRKIFLRSPRGYLVIALILVVLMYIIYQFSFLFFGPKLMVSSPTPDEKISGNVVRVAGETDPYATVSIDNEDVYVDIAGNFQKSIYLYTGDNTIEIIAKNRYGKETKKDIDVQVK